MPSSRIVAAVITTLTMVIGCAHPEPEASPCPDGTIAAVEGCIPLRSWPTPSGDSGLEPNEQDASANDADVFDGGLVDTGPVDTGVAPPSGLAGTWALRVLNTQLTENAAFGPEPVTSTTLSRIDVTDVDGEVRFSGEVCGIENTRFGIFVTVHPPASIAATGLAFAPGEFGDDPPSLTIEFAQYFGLELNDPLADPVPENGDDPRLRDGDADGNPGLTLLLVNRQSQLEMFIAQRTRFRLTATETSTDAARGAVDAERSQIVLGGSIGNVDDYETTAMPLPDQSGFEMVRIDGETTCESILALEDQVFER